MPSYKLEQTFATLPYTERGAPIVLGGDPKGKNFLYTNGNSVIIRDIANPQYSDVYTQHSTRVRVAKYSPTGFYICSGDNSGKVRIWDTTQTEHILKNEFQPLGGAIKDIAWDGDSQRIAVVGEGREKFGHVFAADAGNSLGEIMGQSKPLNSVAFKPNRPFRIATASEDFSIAFFHGPPFKFNCTIKDHTGFVNSVRYSGNGEYFVSGGADGKSFIYDGKTGQLKGELGSPAHKGGIYAVCPSPDNTRVLTVSGDKMAKIWDVQTSSVVTEFNMGSAVQDMQVGCLWQGDYLLSVSLSGYINYLDVNNPSRPLRILKGHNKPITSMVISKDQQSIYTGASDGKICAWNKNTGDGEMVSGNGHSNQIQEMTTDDDKIYSCGMDDTVLITSMTDKTHKESIKMPSQPKGISAHNGLVAVACVNDIVLIREDHVVFGQKVKFEPLSCAIHPGQHQLAFGGNDEKVHIFDISQDVLTETKTLSQTGAVLDTAYSPDGGFLAASDSNRRVCLYRLPNYETTVDSEWCMHTARVNTIDWTANSQYIGTGSLDTNVIVWYPENTRQKIMIKAAHPQNQINSVKWIDEHTLVSTGHDSCIRTWSISHA